MTLNKTPTLNNATTTLKTPATTLKLFNPVTGKEFFGTTAALLQEAALDNGFRDLEWATMKQWNRAKETIARGQKGTVVDYTVKKPDGTEEPRRDFLFNRCQLESAIIQDTGV